MILKFSKQNISFTVITILFFAFRYLSVNVATLIAVLVFSILFFFRTKDFISALSFSFLLLLIPIISLHGLFEVRGYYQILKDVWYFVNPLFLFYIGFLISNYIKKTDSLLLLIVFIGTIFSFTYSVDYYSQINSGLIDYKEIRDEIGKSSYLSVLSFCIGLNLFKITGRKLKVLLLICLSIILFSTYLAFSRTMWFALFSSILIINFKVLQKDFKMKITYVTTFVVIVSVFLLSIQGTDFYQKILFSIDEISSKQYWTLVDINERWRAYETYRALQTYSSGSLAELIVGFGSGFLLDLKVLIELGDDSFRYIPILHNGYAYLLLKTGLVGLVCYLLFFYRCLIRAYRTDDILVKNLLYSIVLLLLASTYVIAGLYNKSSLSQITLLLGIFISMAIRNEFYGYSSR
jgi:hypothetical protein